MKVSLNTICRYVDLILYVSSVIVLEDEKEWENELWLILQPYHMARCWIHIALKVSTFQLFLQSIEYFSYEMSLNA